MHPLKAVVKEECSTPIFPQSVSQSRGHRWASEGGSVFPQHLRRGRRSGARSKPSRRCGEKARVAASLVLTTRFTQENGFYVRINVYHYLILLKIRKHSPKFVLILLCDKMTKAQGKARSSPDIKSQLIFNLGSVNTALGQIAHESFYRDFPAGERCDGRKDRRADKLAVPSVREGDQIRRCKEEEGDENFPRDDPDRRSHSTRRLFFCTRNKTGRGRSAQNTAAPQVRRNRLSGAIPYSSTNPGQSHISAR